MKIHQIKAAAGLGRQAGGRGLPRRDAGGRSLLGSSDPELNLYVVCERRKCPGPSNNGKRKLQGNGPPTLKECAEDEECKLADTERTSNLNPLGHCWNIYRRRSLLEADPIAEENLHDIDLRSYLTSSAATALNLTASPTRRSLLGGEPETEEERQARLKREENRKSNFRKTTRWSGGNGARGDKCAVQLPSLKKKGFYGFGSPLIFQLPSLVTNLKDADKVVCRILNSKDDRDGFWADDYNVDDGKDDGYAGTHVYDVHSLLRDCNSPSSTGSSCCRGGSSASMCLFVQRDVEPPPIKVFLASIEMGIHVRYSSKQFVYCFSTNGARTSEKIQLEWMTPGEPFQYWDDDRMIKNIPPLMDESPQYIGKAITCRFDAQNGNNRVERTFNLEYIMKNCHTPPKTGWDMSGRRRSLLLSSTNETHALSAEDFRRRLQGAEEDDSYPVEYVPRGNSGDRSCCTSARDGRFCIFTAELPASSPRMQNLMNKPPPPRASPPPPPPKVISRPTENTFNSSPNMTMSGETVDALRGACSRTADDDNAIELISEWAVAKYGTSTTERGEPSSILRVESVCTSVSTLNPRRPRNTNNPFEIDGTSGFKKYLDQCRVVEEKGDPRPMVNKSSYALVGHGVACDHGEGLLRWSFKSDDRAWYVRDKKAFKLTSECCKLGDNQMGGCRKVRSGCVAGTPETSKTGAWPELHRLPAVRCDAGRDEVMTGFKFVDDGCLDSDEGKLFGSRGSFQVEAICCEAGGLPPLKAGCYDPIHPLGFLCENHVECGTVGPTPDDDQ